MTAKRRKKKNSDFSIKDGFITLTVVLIAVFLAANIALNMYLSSLKPIPDLAKYRPNLVTQFESSDGETIKTFSAYKSINVSSSEIPKLLKEAVIATEDKNFYHHRGYDSWALLRSMFSNLQAGRYAQGASTITQQLARIMFLSNEKTLDRKLKEFVISHRIEKTLTKDEILTRYLNSVYLGEGAYGVGAAAQIYFNKTLDELTLPEIAMIAGLPQAPSRYSPYYKKENAINRQHQVLKRMLKEKYITKTEYESAMNSELKLNPNHSPYSLNKAPYFIDYVLDELEELGFSEQQISNGGYRVITTLNYKGQKAAEDAISNGLRKWGLTKIDDQAALVSFDVQTGQILAYVGGKNYVQSQYNRVTDAIRQPGSAFKMFIYTAAILNGVKPEDMYDDTPVKIGGWAPHNYGNKYRGKIPVHRALTVSSNVVAARLIQQVGLSEVYRITRSMGITTPIQNDLTIALGSSGVKLIELTRAYGILANNGIKVKPYSVEKVITSTGKVIYKAEPEQDKVLDIYTAATMTKMLKEVVEHGTARAIIMKGRQIAGKTGTTDNYRDACIVAYTPEIVTGVWVGNDNNKPRKSITGGTLPAQIWANYMKVALSDIPESKFNYPDMEEEVGFKQPSQDIKEDVPTEEPASEEGPEASVQTTPALDVPLPIDPKVEEKPASEAAKKFSKKEKFDSSSKVQDMSQPAPRPTPQEVLPTPVHAQ